MFLHLSAWQRWASDAIAKIAAESNSDQKRRAQLQSKTAKLREGLDICEASLDGFHLGIQTSKSPLSFGECCGD